MEQEARPNKVIILLTIERTGSTWLSDLIRCHPAIKYWSTAVVCKDLKLPFFRRYPTDLSNTPDATEEIEISLKNWEKIPDFDILSLFPIEKKYTIYETYAIEKLHPHFFDFKSFSFLENLIKLEDSGIEVKLIYVVRDPQAALTSFLNYQQRNSKWHRELNGERLVQYTLKQYKSILELCRYKDGLIVDYSEIKTNSELLLRKVYNYLWPYSSSLDQKIIENVSKFAHRATDRVKRVSMTNSPFLGKKEGQVKGNYNNSHANFFNLQEKNIEKCYDVYYKILDLNKLRDNIKIIRYFNLANYWKQNHNIEKAISTYQKAIMINPNSAYLYYNLGETLAQQKKWGQAVQLYRKAVEINPLLAGFQYKLAEALVQNGSIEESINHYQKALDINPEFSLFKRKLAKIIRLNQGL
ncbi:MAG: tetratricopeptide repeat protein [Microcoleaceae cyanobacterium]